MRYPGGKGVLYKNLINLIPPHDAYIETHLGGGAVIRNKLPASINIGIDIDPAVHKKWRSIRAQDLSLICDDAVKVLKRLDLESYIKKNLFIYADPPYLNCKSRCPYKYGYTREQHIELLECLLELSSPFCQIMISGYWTELYAGTLKGWHTQTFETMTRGGMATEWVWMNYPTPTRLHDYRYIGRDFRERERIKRKQNRWIKNLKHMPEIERRAMIERIVEECQK